MTKALFKCKQNELISVAKICHRSYVESQPMLQAHKGKYTVAWGDGLLAQIELAEKEPNFQTRTTEAEVMHLELVKKNGAVCEKWQGLKLYIADVPGWANIQKPMLEAAGQKCYMRAMRKNWKETMTLIAMANGFMADHAAELVTAENMPAAFIDEFRVLGEAFEEEFVAFTDETQDNWKKTSGRLEEYNKLFVMLSGMLADGAYVFRKDEAMRNRFTFSAVLDRIRTDSAQKRAYAVGPLGLRTLEKVVPRSHVVNTGDTVLWVEAGAVTAIGPNAVELRPEGSVRAYWPVMTVHNPEAMEGVFEARASVGR